MGADNRMDRAEVEAEQRSLAADVAAGARPASLVLRGGRVVDVYGRRIAAGDVALAGERIAAVGDVANTIGEGTEVLDCDGLFVLPGFVEPHLHVGSSQLTVERLAEVLVPRGTIAYSTCFYEPAVIAGAEAVQELLDRSAGTGLDVLLSPFAAALGQGPLGASRFTVDDLLALLRDDRCVELREWGYLMSQVPGARELYVEALRHGLTIAGHLEGLRGPLLQASVALGCCSDHETATADEAVEKARAGIVVQIREGSGARDLRALVPAITEHGADPACFAFSTDEQELASLVEDGHLDHKMRLAVREGLAPLDAVRMATLGAARSMGVERDYGAVAPGRIASLALVDDLAGFGVRRVVARGRLAAEDGQYVLERSNAAYPEAWSDTIRLARPLAAEDFAVEAGSGPIRVISVRPGSLLTEELSERVDLADGGRLTPSGPEGAGPAEDSALATAGGPERVGPAGTGALAKIAVADRHEASGRVGVALIRGLDIARGAFASTINPGMANLMVVGVDEADMALAANRVAELGGGIVVARDGEVRAEVALPIFGLLSHEPLERTTAACLAVDRALRDELGCPHAGILTTAGFVCLASAIPSLKVCDRGLVRVERGRPPEVVALAV